MPSAVVADSRHPARLGRRALRRRPVRRHGGGRPRGRPVAVVVDSHRPAPGGAIGEPFEHDRAARGDAPLGAALESAPGRAVAALTIPWRGGWALGSLPVAGS